MRFWDSDFKLEMKGQQGTIALLHKLVYSSVSDIDAFTGGVSEDPIPDAVVGMDRVKIIGWYLIGATNQSYV